MATNPFDKFSPKAQAVLAGAFQLLRQYQHNQLEVEHLLLAMLSQENGTTTQVLTQTGVETAPLKQAVQERLEHMAVASQPESGGTATVTTFITPRLQQVFNRAALETQPPPTGGLSEEHLLLAMLVNADDPLAVLLKQSGVDRAKILESWQPKAPSKTAEEPAQSSLTHFNEAGRARMVDVSAKETTVRRAVARGEIVMEAATLNLIREGKAKKGDVLAVAQVAGIMAAKKTHEIIPMCHPLLLTGIDLRFDYDESRHAVLVEAEVRTTGQTGVEMEALTAVSAATLTIYDMVKATDRSMRIGNIHLVHKSGGKSGTFDSGEG
jgi:cyclic pyranopterin phosphate synthase